MSGNAEDVWTAVRVKSWRAEEWPSDWNHPDVCLSVVLSSNWWTIIWLKRLAVVEHVFFFYMEGGIHVSSWCVLIFNLKIIFSFIVLLLLMLGFLLHPLNHQIHRTFRFLLGKIYMIKCSFLTKTGQKENVHFYCLKCLNK